MTFKQGNTNTTCVLRNYDGEIREAWISFFTSPYPYIAETEATIQTLTIASNLKLDKVTIEGDAHNVIMTLKGLEEYDDWQAKDTLE